MKKIIQIDENTYFVSRPIPLNKFTAVTLFQKFVVKVKAGLYKFIK